MKRTLFALVLGGILAAGSAYADQTVIRIGYPGVGVDNQPFGYGDTASLAHVGHFVEDAFKNDPDIKIQWTFFRGAGPELNEALAAHQLDFAAVRERLPDGMGEADWLALRPNLKRVDEAADWWAILHGHVEQPAAAEDKPLLAAAAEVCAAIDWSETPWPPLVAQLKTETGRGGRALFLPLRRALTGRDSGPEMAALLPLIGRDEAIARLRAAAA